MNIFRLRRVQTGGQTPALVLPTEVDEVITLTDRAAPGWARGLSYAFALGSGLCVLSLAVMAVFFQSLVVTEFQGQLAPIFIAVGLVPLAGILLFEYAHGQALAGYRHARRIFFLRGQAALAVGVAIVLALVHPLLGVPVLAAGLLAYGGQGFLARRKAVEPYWDFSRKEAVSVLAGRDRIGQQLATRVPENHSLSHALNRVAGWLAVLLGLGLGSWLAAQGILGLPAVAAVTLISFWAAEALARHLTARFMSAPFEAALAGSVARVVTPEGAEGEVQGGLNVRALSVVNSREQTLLADVNFALEAGTVTGILGESGGGKSLLLKAIVDPYGLAGLDVRGSVRLETLDLWARQAADQSVPAIHLSPTPLTLPASGQENLTCFGRISNQMHAEKALEKLVFSADAVRTICAAPDASKLPDMQQKALAYARGFLLTPSLYLLDRPEDALPEKQISALIALLKQEVRLGRTVVMVTEHRALLDLCDKLVILQEGRVNDMGDASEIRTRLSSGWSRFVAARRLEAEDNLERWVRAHFKREGDEVNRRRACTIASEMLALSCQSADPMANQTIAFEFKQFEGYCMLKLIDSDPAIGAARLQKAVKLASNPDPASRLPPLAALIAAGAEIEAGTSMDRRTLTARIGTYDPRKTGGKPPTSAQAARAKPNPQPENQADIRVAERRAKRAEQVNSGRAKAGTTSKAKPKVIRSKRAQSKGSKAQDAS